VRSARPYRNAVSRLAVSIAPRQKRSSTCSRIRSRKGLDTYSARSPRAFRPFVTAAPICFVDLRSARHEPRSRASVSLGPPSPSLSLSLSLSRSLALAVVGISLNREWRAGRPSCGRHDGIFIGLNIGKPPIRNAIPAPRLRSAPWRFVAPRRIAREGGSRENEEKETEKE